MEKEYSNQYIKHTFGESEKKEIAIAMAQTVGDLQCAEDEKKALVSEFKSRIDKLQAEINLAAGQLRSGYEMRNVKCEVERDYKRRVVRYWRTDIDDSVMAKERTMTAEELQRDLPK